MPKKSKGKQTKKNNEGETSYDVPLNFSLESSKDNVPIEKRKLFECVFKGKGKETQTENRGQIDLFNDVVYSTALLNEVEQN
ncbi:hypothetical protein IC575_006287 [Cucumis melo]